MGPLVYLLPLFSPLRMIDEICMLDHLSHGRAEIGVGRGVSPFELKYHKIEHDQSRDIFIDAYRCISEGLTTDTLTYKGPALRIRERADRAPPAAAAAPAVLVRLLRRRGLDLGGRGGAALRHASAPTPSAKANIDTFKEAFAKRGKAGAAQAGVFRRHRASACSGTSSSTRPTRRRMRLAKPAMNKHLEHINWIRTARRDRPTTRASTCRAARITRNAWRRAP